MVYGVFRHQITSTSASREEGRSKQRHVVPSAATFHIEKMLRSCARSSNSPRAPTSVGTEERSVGLSGCYSNRLGDMRGLVADLESEAERSSHSTILAQVLD